MPRVPTYDTQPLQPTIRQGEARPVLGVEQATLPGRQIQEAGETLGRAGAALGQYVLQRQNDLNEAQALDAFNQAERLTQEFVREYGSFSGLNAIRNERFGEAEPITFYAGEIDRSYGEILDQLNPAVRQRVAPRLFALRTRAVDQFTRHFNAQNTVYQTGIHETNRTQASQALITSLDDPAAAQAALDRITQSTEALGLLNGQDQETINLNSRAAVSNALTIAHTGLIEANRIPEAERLQELYGDRFTPEARVEAQNVLNRAGAIYYGGQITDQVMAEYPAGRNDTGARARDRRARDLATVDGVFQEDRYRRAVQEIERRVSLTQRDIAASDAQSWDQFLRLHMEDPVRALTYASTLPAELHSRAVTYDNNGGRTTVAQQREFRSITGRPGFDAAALSQQELDALRPRIGEENYATLVSEARTQQERQQQERVLSQSASVNELSRSYLEGVLDIGARDRVDFGIALRRAIGVEQSLRGRALTYEEQIQVGLREFTEVSIKPSGSFFSTTRRFSELTEEEAQTIEISRADQDRIRDALAEVRDAYLAQIERTTNAQEIERLQALANRYDTSLDDELVRRVRLQELRTGEMFGNQ